MPFTIAHAADLHLDRAFTEHGLRGRARERRLALRDAFARVLDVAKSADALCIAGDLYEHEHVTGDTQNMLVSRLEALERPVLLLPGNHDPHLPGSVYDRARWPGNVHVFRHPHPEPFELRPDLVVWGIPYTGRELSPDAVRAFRVPDDGRTHLLMLDASVIGGFPGAESDHCPVTREELAATGARFVLLGHHHAGKVWAGACYPGSPEPLTWGERGAHAVALVQVKGSEVRAELREVNALSFAQLEIDVTGAASGAEVEERLRAALGAQAAEGRSLRARLVGEIAPECELLAAELAERCGEGFAELVVEDATVPAFDLAAIALERTVRGRFVAELLERAEGTPEEAARMRAAAHAGLRALAGRRDLARVA